MLSGSSFYSDAALKKTVDLTFTFSFSMLFEIFLHITICGFFSNRTDRSCAEGVSFSKYNLGFRMRSGLIFSGKIKINIRFLISVKTKESFKWNIESVFFQRFPSNRADFVRHITSCLTGKCKNFRRIKFRILTGRAIIMRR